MEMLFIIFCLFLPLNAPIATKVVCFSRLLKNAAHTCDLTCMPVFLKLLNVNMRHNTEIPTFNVNSYVLNSLCLRVL